jgi:SAM-dependent methyltransferase
MLRTIRNKETHVTMVEPPDLFIRHQDVFVLRDGVQHRDDEYDQRGFDVLLKMQRNHFWYRGRHKFLLNVVERELGGLHHPPLQTKLSAIDIGGGCGGWVEYLHLHSADLFGELALGDSSLRALTLASPVVGSFAARYQIDLLDLRWRDRWDVVFLLDVIEHQQADVEAIRQARDCLRPGGLLFVTVPALQFFWTYNDELAKHQRRYSRRDFEHLAQATGMELLRAYYFMFFLSPILYLARRLAKPPRLSSSQEIQAFLARTHRIPPRAVNKMLQAVFTMESILGHHIRFPWGTSLLGVFRR